MVSDRVMEMLLGMEKAMLRKICVYVSPVKEKKKKCIYDELRKQMKMQTN